MLILDEPTSGVDPVARDEFWGLLIDLSRDQGVTIFISTHFMNEAERCDRISLMHAGRVLASGTPAALMRQRGADYPGRSLHRLSRKRPARRHPRMRARRRLRRRRRPRPAQMRRPARLGGFSFAPPFRLQPARDDGADARSDPLAFALLGTAFLMLVFGYGITFDVEKLTYAALDRDQTPESRTYLEGFAGSRYFQERPPIKNHADMDHRLKSGDITLAIEIPPDFGKALLQGRRPEVAAWIDGAMPFRAETIRGYVEGLHRPYLADAFAPRLSASSRTCCRPISSRATAITRPSRASSPSFPR